MRKIAIIVLCSFLLALPVQAAERYVAIGDSLAAGQTPNSMIDAGYADFIALRLASRSELTHFTKELAFSGFTSEQVLQRVKEPYAQPLLNDATLITISAGANDLLSLVRTNANIGEVSFDQFAADFALNNVRQHVATMLKELAVRAPNADVFVIGYYFPYPHVHNAQKNGLSTQLTLLNTILQQQAETNGATFIDVSAAYGNDAKAFLPNPSDVHPNFAGYMAMANAFLQEQQLQPLTASELPAPNPISFEEIVQQLSERQQQQSVAVATTSIEQYMMPHGVQRLERLYARH